MSVHDPASETHHLRSRTVETPSLLREWRILDGSRTVLCIQNALSNAPSSQVQSSVSEIQKCRVSLSLSLSIYQLRLTSASSERCKQNTRRHNITNQTMRLRPCERTKERMD